MSRRCTQIDPLWTFRYDKYSWCIIGFSRTRLTPAHSLAKKLFPSSPRLRKARFPPNLFLFCCNLPDTQRKLSNLSPLTFFYPSDRRNFQTLLNFISLLRVPTNSLPKSSDGRTFTSGAGLPRESPAPEGFRRNGSSVTKQKNTTCRKPRPTSTVN